jgi:hypothetical protein
MMGNSWSMRVLVGSSTAYLRRAICS